MEVSYDSLAKLNGEEELTTLKFRGHGGGGGVHFGHSWSDGGGGKYGSRLWYGMDIF